MQAVKSNFSQICAQGISNGYDVMLASLLLSLPSSCIHPWLTFLPSCRLISFFLKYLEGNRNENLKSLSNFVWAEGSLQTSTVKQALLTTLSSFPYGQFMLISRQLQIIEDKYLCRLSDKAETRNMYMTDFGELIGCSAVVLHLQGTGRLSSSTNQRRLIWDHHKRSQNAFHKWSHYADWGKLVISERWSKPLCSVCVQQEPVSLGFAVLQSHFQYAIKRVIRKRKLASLTRLLLYAEDGCGSKNLFIKISEYV